MSDNTTLPTGSGGDTIRTIDRSIDSTPITAKTQVVQLDVGGESNESLVTQSTPLPATLAPNDNNQLAQLVPLMQLLLAEIRVTNLLLQNGLNVQGDLDVLRSDTAITNFN